jgi:hypothetical protein
VVPAQAPHPLPGVPLPSLSCLLQRRNGELDKVFHFRKTKREGSSSRAQPFDCPPRRSTTGRRPTRAYLSSLLASSRRRHHHPYPHYSSRSHARINPSTSKRHRRCRPSAPPSSWRAPRLCGDRHRCWPWCRSGLGGRRRG